MTRSMRQMTGASLALVAWLALAASAQDLPPGPGTDDVLPDDMEQSVSSGNPFLPSPGQKLSAETVLSSWMSTPRKLAEQITKRYGPPDGVTPRALSWHHRAPWERIVVREDAATHNFPFLHGDWLEETVSYRVPPDKFGELAAFDGSLLADRTRGELTARSDSEKANFAALNLADDIVGGKKTVEEARNFLSRLLRSTQASPYTKGLAFDKNAAAADADRSANDSE